MDNSWTFRKIKITKANSISISTFDFSTLSAKLLHNKLLRLENGLMISVLKGVEMAML